MDLWDARRVLAENLHAAMNRPGRPVMGQQELARLADAFGTKKLSQSTISRILNAEVSCGVDQLVILASILHLEPWQLLVPKMNPDDPPVLTSISKKLEEFQSTLKKQADEIATMREHLAKPK